jgi:uncharacterized protein YxjI
MFDRQSYIVREHVGFLKMTDTYDILDPENGKMLGLAQERISGWMTFLRLLLNKQMLPTKVVLIEGDDPASLPAITIERGFTFLRSKLSIKDAQGGEIGSFRSRLFTLGGAFDIFDPSGRRIGMVKGDWKGWNFRFLDDTDKEIGTITKKWAGLGKELFTSADTYAVALNAGTPTALMPLLLAAGLAIDVVYKEKG